MSRYYFVCTLCHRVNPSNRLSQDCGCDAPYLFYSRLPRPWKRSR